MPNVKTLWSSMVRAFERRRSRLPAWLRTYGRALSFAILGLVFVLSPAALFPCHVKWTEATNGYILFVTLVVLWWYAQLTHRIAENGVTVRAEANKPFVVLERSLDPDRPGHFHYWASNPGIAVNVFQVVPKRWSEIGPALRELADNAKQEGE